MQRDVIMVSLLWRRVYEELPVEPRQLMSFVAVARKLSFSRAAAELSYAQSTVTQHVKGLERTLGVSLFDRLPGQIRLTSAGNRLLPYAISILDLTEGARRAATDDPVHGSLVVGTMESITAYRLLPVVEHMHVHFPNVGLAMRSSICAETCKAVLDGMYDCGLVIDIRTQFPAGLESKILCAEPLSLVAMPYHPLVGPAVVETEQLQHERIIGTERGCAYRDMLETELNSKTGEPFPILELNTVDSVKRGVAAGLGIALLPRVAVSQEIAVGQLAELNWMVPNEVFTQILWRPSQYNRPTLRALIDTVSALIGDQEESMHS